MPIKTCKHCGKEYQARSKRGSYCDGPCFVDNERAATRRRQATYSPLRRQAAILVQGAIARGDLKRQPCEVCGKASLRWEAIQAHHDDYAKPLEVRWLCRSHHKSHHHKFGPGKNAFLATPVTGA